MAAEYQQSVEEYVGSNGADRWAFVISIAMAVLSVLVDISEIAASFQSGFYKEVL
jgi:predicted alternative tryptophan synthase beta-subunit